MIEKNLRVPKTVKLFIGGEFPRTESGRSLPVYEHGTQKVFAHLCRASRKDFRNAVTASLSARSEWERRSAYNRAQIIYRMAEMAEGHREEMVSIMEKVGGVFARDANTAVDEAIDAFVYYAGFADKFSQISGCVNPVSGPHHAFTTPEPVGCVAAVFDDEVEVSVALPEVTATIAAIVASGNVVTGLFPLTVAPLLAPLSEIFATSDLPKGVVNLLTGQRSELLEHFASHMEVQSISYVGSDRAVREKLKALGAENMKRIVCFESENGAQKGGTNLSVDRIANFVEFKTVWHPIGH